MQTRSRRAEPHAEQWVRAQIATLVRTVVPLADAHPSLPLAWLPRARTSALRLPMRRLQRDARAAQNPTWTVLARAKPLAQADASSAVASASSLPTPPGVPARVEIPTCHLAHSAPRSRGIRRS